MIYRHQRRRYSRFMERHWSLAQWTRIARWFDDGVYWIRHRDHDWGDDEAYAGTARHDRSNTPSKERAPN